jgi:hypothetical protein
MRSRNAHPLSAAERMRRFRARQRNAGLVQIRRWLPREEVTCFSPFSDHRLLDARSLALHCVIARKIQKDEKLLAVAQSKLANWFARAADAPPSYLQEWCEILSLPVVDILAVMTDFGERSCRLRQSSPFVGILSATERKRIFEAFRA